MTPNSLFSVARECKIPRGRGHTRENQMFSDRLGKGFCGFFGNVSPKSRTHAHGFLVFVIVLCPPKWCQQLPLHPTFHTHRGQDDGSLTNFLRLYEGCNLIQIHLLGVKIQKSLGRDNLLAAFPLNLPCSHRPGWPVPATFAPPPRK